MVFRQVRVDVRRYCGPVVPTDDFVRTKGLEAALDVVHQRAEVAAAFRAVEHPIQGAVITDDDRIVLEGLAALLDASAEGQPLTVTYLDYGKCSTAETPRVEVIHRPEPSPYTPLGQKAAGEGAAIPSPAAIASAVEDALTPFKVKVCELPLTPEAVWRLANHNPETERRSY